MIERLENAGLGYFVAASETHQRLGKKPMHLGALTGLQIQDINFIHRENSSSPACVSCARPTA
jgi:hypothetical protein